VVTYLKRAQRRRRGMKKKTHAELAETRQKIQDILDGEYGEEDEGGTGL
jgi:exonuclease VII small subunit